MEMYIQIEEMHLWISNGDISLSLCLSLAIVVAVDKEQFLHFGDLQPTNGVDGGKKEGEPGQTERVAERDRATRAYDVEDYLEVKTVVAFAFDEYLAVEDGQHEEQEDGDEQVENPRGERNGYAFRERRRETRDP